MDGRVLVVGGTGMLGEPVARRLAADGRPVRVLSRRPERAVTRFGGELEVVGGDVDDLDSLRSAARGCVGIHLSLAGAGDWDLERRGAVAAARVAEELGVQRITYLSGASALEENTWFAMTAAKVAAEAALRDSGVGFTVFKCTMFMESLPNLVRGDRALIMGSQPHPWHFLAAADYAAMVSRAYDTPEAAGRSLYVYGPEPLTMEQAMRSYVERCAPQARLTHVPFWMLSLMSLMPGRHELRRVGLPVMRYFSRVGETEDPTEANELLGAPGTTLAAWCEARAAGAG